LFLHQEWINNMIMTATTSLLGHDRLGQWINKIFRTVQEVGIMTGTSYVHSSYTKQHP
jgi:hypothetical protein